MKKWYYYIAIETESGVVKSHDLASQDFISTATLSLESSDPIESNPLIFF